MSRLRKFLSLGAPDRRLLLSAAAWLVALRIGVTLLPFARLRALIGRIRPAPRSPFGAARLRACPEPSEGAGPLPAPNRVAWAVTTAARHLPFSSTCLTRALAAQVLLTRHGHQSRLRIGVARTPDDRFRAHAWVETEEGVLLGGMGSERYTPLVALERPT